MQLSVPIYVEELAGAQASHLVARPLFMPEPQRSGDRLQRVLARLSSDLRREYARQARKPRLDELLARACAPLVDEAWLEVRLETPRGSANVAFLVVTWEALGRRIALVPALKDVCFEVLRGQELADRTVAVVQRHFRDLMARNGDEATPPSEVFVARRAWVTQLEIPVQVPARFEANRQLNLAQLGGSEPESGTHALERIGRNLNSLYPDGLDRALEREGEVEELIRLATDSERRAVLLVGRRQVGKTAVAQEALRRILSRRTDKDPPARQWWQITPARLIAGMSYVGQWEQRVIAILEESMRRDHILYFEDLPGLFLAGVSASSNLTVAHVLKPWMERRDVRFICEITPESLRFVRERDRGFADLFQVLPVAEMGEHATLRCLLGVQRDLEEQAGCRFALDALPAALDLMRYHGGDTALPGKVAGFLRRLALKRRDRDIARADVLEGFRESSGLSPLFLDRHTRLARDEVFDSLSRRVVGQTQALRAAADAIHLARARLNDPERPLASLLFLGPSGVGKTECAKALAAFLFGDADRLVRFDMNEYVSPAAVARLVGTRSDPEGLLTGVVRRQPFSVLLFDEIEKADPHAHDLLLSVLGEGRLTDALGRTSSFSGCLIVMTSNLGAREARHRLGFDPEGVDPDLAYLHAARDFFRPEFFNRIDRLVPFRPLDRADLTRIAQQQLNLVLNRHGFHQRRCVVRVEPDSVERLVDAGSHPLLGARALKRTIERDVAQPLARHLAATVAGDVVMIQVRRGPQNLEVQTQPIRPAPSRARPSWTTDRDAARERLEIAVQRLARELGEREPAGPVAVDVIQPEQARYFAAREQLRRVQAQIRQGHASEQPAPVIGGVRSVRARTLSRRQRTARFSERGLHQQAQADAALRQRLADLGTGGKETDAAPFDWFEGVVGEVALLQHLLTAPVVDRVRLVFRVEGGELDGVPSSWWIAVDECFSRMWGYRGELVRAATGPAKATAEAGVLHFTGPGAFALAECEAGVQLFEATDGRITLVSATIERLAADEGAPQVLTSPADEARPAVLLREFEGGTRMQDHRSGLMLEGGFTATNLRQLVLAALPLPQELTEEGD